MRGALGALGARRLGRAGVFVRAVAIASIASIACVAGFMCCMDNALGVMGSRHGEKLLTRQNNDAGAMARNLDTRRHVNGGKLRTWFNSLARLSRDVACAMTITPADPPPKRLTMARSPHP